MTATGNEPTLEDFPAPRRRREFMLSRWFINVSRLVLAIVLITGWQLSSGRLIDPFFVSSPSAVAFKLWTWLNNGSLWYHLSITLWELCLGFILGASFGVALGIVVGLSTYVTTVIRPFIISMYSVPKIALMPLFIVWFGLGLLPKILLATIGVFFVVFFTTVTGVSNVSRDLVNVLDIMGARRWQIILKVILPSAAGWVFSGLRISLPQAFIGAVSGELLASNRGIGYLIQDSAGMFDTAGVFAGLMLLIIAAWTMSILLDFVENRASGWIVTVDRSH